MNAYAISRLARDAGVSVHVVRDYVLRGLLHPAHRTESGYGIYDAQALVRLRFVRAAFEAGIGLHELTRLCHALLSPAFFRFPRTIHIPGLPNNRPCPRRSCRSC